MVTTPTFSEVSTTPFATSELRNHAVWRGVQQTHKAVTGLRGQRRFVVGDRVQQQHQVFLFGRQFVFQDVLIGGDQRFQRIDFIGRDGDGGESFTRNGVTQGAAVEIDQTQIQLLRMACEEARQQLVGVTQTDVNFAAGVAAFQPF
jgi:hypothetical protein